MTDTLKLGVIGVGYLGKYHAQKYAAMENVSLVGVADVDSQAAQKVAKMTHCTPFADYKELIDQVDALSVVVPTSLHHRVALDCLARSRDILIEKPMTTTLAEADELIARADESGRIIQVGHIERYNPAIVAMRNYLTRPRYIESQRTHIFTDRGTDVDVVLDLMIHDIDIILSIVDSELVSLYPMGMSVVTDHTDIANVQLVFANGCRANVTVSRIAENPVRSLRIFQPESAITVDYGSKEIRVIERDKISVGNDLKDDDYLEFCFRDQDALEAELTDFVSNVRNRTKPAASGREGRQALAVALEIMEKIQKSGARSQDSEVRRKE